MNLKVLTAAALLILATTSLDAEELCVECTGPPATYRCDAASNPATGASFQLLCVKQIATRGGHDRCSVDRTRSNIPCNGVLVTLDQPADGAALSPPSPATNSAAPPIATPPSTPPVAAPTPAQSHNGPPATMEELAKETAEQSKKDWAAANDKVQESAQAAGQNLKKAGGAVGDAVKKSWNCVVSLFSQC